MCFSPQISLLTAITEFILAFIIFYRFKKTITTQILATLILFLGGYQLTEFFLCTTGNAPLWGAVGFSIYTFLPFIGLFLAIKHTKKTISTPFLFIPALLFASIPLFMKTFITAGTCYAMFISVQNAFMATDSLLVYLYLSYYFGYLAVAVILFLSKHQARAQKQQSSLLAFGLLLITLPPILLVLILPALGYVFPSMYCEFALVFALIAYYAAYREHRFNTTRRQ